MNYSAEECMDASDEGEPFLISEKQATKILKDHGMTMAEYLADVNLLITPICFDAGALAKWLGY